MFILEDYDHAKARGARIYAEITGYASTCEAFHRVRMSDSPEEPARAINLALEEARIAPEDIQYVNLHGTSTEMNDRVETRALKLALGKHAGKDSDVRIEVANRTRPGRLRLRQPGRHPDRDGARQNSSDYQSRCP